MAPSKHTKQALPPVAIQPFTSNLKADPNKVSLLLDLPAELRNSIYELILASYNGVKLSRYPRHRNLGYPFSALTRVNKQVHHEFSSAAFLFADIHTIAMNYDFRHIVTFLNRLSAEEDIPSLPSIHSTRTSHVITVMLHTSGYGDEPEFLDRWINRAAHPTKKGMEVSFRYVLSPGCRDFLGRSIESRAQKWENRARKLPEGRKREEFDKIIEAVR